MGKEPLSYQNPPCSAKVKDGTGLERVWQMNGSGAQRITVAATAFYSSAAMFFGHAIGRGGMWCPRSPIVKRADHNDSSQMEQPGMAGELKVWGSPGPCATSPSLSLKAAPSCGFLYGPHHVVLQSGRIVAHSCAIGRKKTQRGPADLLHRKTSHSSSPCSGWS